MITRYADIFLNIPWGSSILTYEVPLHLSNLTAGSRVSVELNGEEMEGIISSLHFNEPNFKTSPIISAIDEKPIVTKDQIELAFWMSEIYLSTPGEALFCMFPKETKPKRTKVDRNQQPIRSLLPLNPEQKNAFNGIQSSQFQTHLLFGITGSGKSEVYFHLMDSVLKKKTGTIIYLVPEISLTYPTIERLESIFPGQVSVLHSHLPNRERFGNYLDLLENKKRICVGTRSAVFAPLENLEYIILDEEHDSSYKENSSPRYHARQIAHQRLLRSSGKLVLGSATPSMEIFHLARSGKIGYSELKKRANPKAKLPEITLITKKQNKDIIDGDLQFKMADRLKRKEQIILLLNRRGYNPFIYNPNSKEYIHCPNCASTLCYHSNGKAKCHLCGYFTSFVELKMKINEDLELLGVGTQKLEENILTLFPSAKVERLDMDRSRAQNVTRDVLHKLSLGEIDILTGTQMIAKGLDFSDVTLVGIINADLSLGVPDFRSTERTFSLIAQVAGRAGRGEKKGEVLVQVSDSSHPVFQMAVRQDYIEFYSWEIGLRRDLQYPPFTRLARLVFRSKQEETASLLSQKYADALNVKEVSDFTILGPSPCPFPKIDSNYRYHILLKSKSIRVLREVLTDLKKTQKTDPKCYVEYDLDPIDLI